MIARQELRQHHRHCVYDSPTQPLDHQLAIIDDRTGSPIPTRAKPTTPRGRHILVRYTCAYSTGPMTTGQQATLIWPYNIMMHLMHLSNFTGELLSIILHFRLYDPDYATLQSPPPLRLRKTHFRALTTSPDLGD